MKNVGVIFDLDDTLVDTTPAKDALEQEDWHEAEKHVSEFRLYDGISEALTFIKDHEIKMAIVSTSPEFYCRHVLTHFGIACTSVIGKNQDEEKPSARPMIDALHLLGIPSMNAITFGDRVKDIQAGKNAAITTAACTWGSKEIDDLKLEGPDFVINSPTEIVEVLAKRFSL
jgi:phosphoglycolate phosphatase-like HAD superfamily hydrolase